jgi:hypothetical protein
MTSRWRSSAAGCATGTSDGPPARTPYLFVTQQTAVGTDPVSSTWFWILFEPLGIHPESLRQDRILD